MLKPSHWQARDAAIWPCCTSRLIADERGEGSLYGTPEFLNRLGPAPRRRMTGRLAFLLFAAALTGWQRADADVICTFKAEYESSFDVIEARVAEVIRDAAPKTSIQSGASSAADTVTLRVYRSYKHRISGLMTVANPRGPGALFVEPGGFYLMFLQGHAAEGALSIRRGPCASRSMAQDNTPLLRLLNRWSGTRLATPH